jgi:hypothetical protein
VKPDARSSLSTAAGPVGTVLADRGIRAVLTGAACASLYTRGRYHSRDMDVQIARTNRVALAAIRRWSHAEGFPHRFDEFVLAVRQAWHARGHADARRRPG